MLWCNSGHTFQGYVGRSLKVQRHCQDSQGRRAASLLAGQARNAGGGQAGRRPGRRPGPAKAARSAAAAGGSGQLKQMLSGFAREAICNRRDLDASPLHVTGLSQGGREHAVPGTRPKRGGAPGRPANPLVRTATHRRRTRAGGEPEAIVTLEVLGLAAASAPWPS